ncbi:FUSC family protein [Shewanella sp. NIFS-20-20]|uniref:FUSC family protein n=1 Tax=Shewanella sp. NIFS-20-20 TaxID=2853806 RepID=UPI001C493AC3|nr:FUSC family protein [Shewanella sp. NIFS-20-20]MBV7314406.1 FUSC family protein [Shewanella sp. NIFS-20-20]
MTLEQLILRYPAWFHALRVTMTSAIAMVIIAATNVPHGVWALITIIMVMGSVAYLGEVLSKARQRIIGTLTGAAMGLSLYLLPASASVAHTGLFLVMLAVSIYFTRSRYSYAMLLCALTLTLVATAGPGNLYVAWERTINVIWGALLAMVTSRVLFPIRAFQHFHILNAELIDSAARIYQAHLDGIDSSQSLQQISQLKSLMMKQTSLLPHAIRESGLGSERLANITEAHKRILHSLQTLTETQWPATLPHTDEQNQLSALMSTLAREMLTRSPTQLSGDALTILHSQGPLSDSDKVNTDLAGYWWLNQELARRVNKLAHQLQQLYH